MRLDTRLKEPPDALSRFRKHGEPLNLTPRERSETGRAAFSASLYIMPTLASSRIRRSAAAWVGVADRALRLIFVRQEQHRRAPVGFRNDPQAIWTIAQTCLSRIDGVGAQEEPAGL